MSYYGRKSTGIVFLKRFILASNTPWLNGLKTLKLTKMPLPIYSFKLPQMLDLRPVCTFCRFRLLCNTQTRSFLFDGLPEVLTELAADRVPSVLEEMPKATFDVLKRAKIYRQLNFPEQRWTSAARCQNLSCRSALKVRLPRPSHDRGSTPTLALCKKDQNSWESSLCFHIFLVQYAL